MIEEFKEFEGIEWVWVDLDDTLWDFTANSRILLRAIYHERDMDRFFTSENAWIDAYEDYNHFLWTEYAAQRVTRAFLMADRFRRPLACAGHPDADGEGAFLDRHYLERLGTMGALVPGARELLGRLRTRGYKIGVLSNGFAEVQRRKLCAAGIEDMVDMMVLSDDIGIQKPDRRLFDYAAERAGTSAVKCLMIGDNLSADIKGALGAGWRAIYFDRRATGRPAMPAGVRTVTDLGHIL